MIKFLLQTVNGEIVHDFVFQLKHAINYQNWFYDEQRYKFELCEKESINQFYDYIPIGSLEFVFEYLFNHKITKSNNIKPINIPEVLRTKYFLGRTYEIMKKEEIKINNYYFVKSADEYKGFTDIINSTNHLKEGDYIVSEEIEILSEWRAFVFNDCIVDLKQYAGDCFVFPDTLKLKEIIRSYVNSPKSYTLDVLVNKKGTFIIEVHPFVSCGLYGFSNYKILPQMMIQGFNELKK